MKAIYKALDSVNKELGSISKSQQGHGYKFRGIDDVFLNIGPLFKKYGILVSRRDVEYTHNHREFEKANKYAKNIEDKYEKKCYGETSFKCKYVFTSTEDGSEFITEGFGEGQDTAGGDKSASMATSNAYKYVIFEMFSIPTAEQQDSDQYTAKTESSSTTAVTVSKKAGSSGFRKKTANKLKAVNNTAKKHAI